MSILLVRLLNRLLLLSAMTACFTILFAVFLALSEIASDVKQLSSAVYLASNGYRVCPPPSSEELIDWLGSAWNARYMSLAPPGTSIRPNGPQFASSDGIGQSGWGLADGPATSEPEQFRHPIHESFAVPSNYRRLLSPLIDDPRYYLSRRRAPRESPRTRNRRNASPSPELSPASGDAEPLELRSFPEATAPKAEDFVDDSELRQSVPRFSPSIPSPAAASAKSDEVFLARVMRAALRPVVDTRQWHCKTKSDWIDLGPDHFPRYVLTNRCASERCWWNRFYCRPKNFALKVLKRLQDKCIEITPELADKYMFPFPVLDSDDPTVRFREPWVFQEIEVAVCCECAP